MNTQCFQAPAWSRAFTLTERVAACRAGRCATPAAEVDAELAARRLRRWRSQEPFSGDAFFAQRLALDGITEEELLALLGEPIEAVHARVAAPSAWLTELAQAFARPAPPDALTFPLPETPHGQEMAGFLQAVGPLLAQARERVRQRAEALLTLRPELPFDPRTIAALLLTNLPRQLMLMVSRTLVLELHVARLRGQLQGDTPAERFQSFVQRLRQRDVVLALLEEYPVLARQLVLRVENAVRFALQFLRHLDTDWEALRATFSPQADPGLLARVEGGVGDLHRGGQAVLIAKFSSGLQVVYKPKALAVDLHFQELLAWLNERGSHPPFRTLKILDRGGYGWVEFVAAEDCASADAVRRFYERQGGYLALLYVLEATDFHHENLIAAGEQPVLIDLESLFHPRAGGVNGTLLDQPAGQAMTHSVLRVGLLPQRLWSHAESEGIDVSGLGAVAGQLLPHTVPSWEGTGTDEIRFARKRMTTPGARNRPTLAGTNVNVLDHADAVAAGFTAVYRLLREHQNELLADAGPLARFAEDEVRVILRATRTYGMLLRESYHPDLLRDALERDCFFDRLWATVPQRPGLAKVVAAERDDLQRGDIPLFTTRPGSRDLWTSGKERVAAFFDEPSLSLVRRQVQQLSEHDLERQLWFIRASLATLAPVVERTSEATYRQTETPAPADREQLLTAARAVGDRLELLALRGGHDVSWIGLTLTPQRRFALLPLGGDLYGGLSGLALFLAYLGAVTQEERYTALAQTTLTTLRRHLERGQAFLTSVGAFDGWGGLIYVLTHLSVLWDQPALREEAETFVERLPPLIEHDERLDVIGGAAGCVSSLLSLYRCAPSGRTLAAAVQAGDRLLACAQPQEHGIAWVSRLTGPKPLTGFSHGTAGMAWALLQLAALTRESRFRTAALAALAYERRLFSPQAGNWPDLREPEADRPAKNGQETFAMAWCHGAPGIGLARLQALPYLEDADTRAEIDTALQTTVTQGFGRNHSLCHGDLGNLELFLQAGERLPDAKWQVAVTRLAAIILDSIRRDGWLCGNPSRVESPGLMTGLAGIGYGLLRLAEPACVPSVLVLAPPMRRGSS